VAFVQIGGEMVEYELRAGEVLLVDPGSLALFDATVRFSVRMVRGITNIMFSQGLFLGELRGPGCVWVETMPMSRLMAAISSRIAVTPAASVRGAIYGITSVLGS
jgi:uncharacterized protein (AIM24 family)